jgi:predicted phosphodiesterase
MARTFPILLAAVLLGAALVAIPPADATTSLRLAAFGDTGTSGATQSNVDGAVADGAQGYLGLGDYEYSASVSEWSSLFQPLTSKGAYMARGNHDDMTALAPYFPQGSVWSRSVNGARIVALDTEQRADVGTWQYDTVRNALCGAPEDVRILIMHKPWWLLAGARHPGTEFPGSASAMDQMVKDCGVDLVLAGHEHNYQRMVRNGVSYVIAGIGGESTYPVAGSPSGTVASFQAFGRVLLDVSPTGYAATVVTLDHVQHDAFSYGALAPAPAPAPGTTPTVSFTDKGGNEWWVQVAVVGSSIARVESMDTGGAWVVLPKQSWGDYAASYHVEPGHLVQHRAVLTNGSIVTSCWYTHPGATCTTTAPAPAPTPAPGTFAATFKNVRGNAWWVESDVAVSGGTLAGVDARVNGGAWIALAKTSWGSWAKSIAAPSGSHVEFRARATDGQAATSASYAWPPA